MTTTTNYQGSEKQVNPKIMLLRDLIMFQIVNSPSSAKFGYNGIIERYEDDYSEKSIIAAVDYLLEQNYLKKLGRFTFGIGTGSGIQKYEFYDQDLVAGLESQPASELPPDEPEHSPNKSSDIEIPQLTSKQNLTRPSRKEIVKALNSLEQKMKQITVDDLSEKLFLLGKLSDWIRPKEPCVAGLLDCIKEDLKMTAKEDS